MYYCLLQTNHVACTNLGWKLFFYHNLKKKSLPSPIPNQDVWDSTHSEELLVPCQREPGSSHNPFTVLIVRVRVTVGHIPTKTSLVCLLFLQRGRLICCQAPGSRHFSKYLPQGGSEIPCLLIYEGGVKDASMAEKLTTSVLFISDNAKPTTENKSDSPKIKWRKLNKPLKCVGMMKILKRPSREQRC